jgi:putative transposase
MCKILKVSTSGFYDWCQRPPSQRQQANATLTVQIREAFAASNETYGMPQLRGVSRRRSLCVTTERDARHRPAPDLVKREFVATDINQLWVADMTYIPTWAGFLYLSVVIDVYSRKVVGWAFGERMTSDLVIQALNMALMTRKPESVIHHSDQGSQYTSIAFGNRCKEMGVRPSMGTVGDAYDNAMAESFFASLECELIARRSWKTKTEARLAVFTWIEGWYNPRRRHSGLNYQSPNTFERKQQDKTINIENQIIQELQ